MPLVRGLMVLPQLDPTCWVCQTTATPPHTNLVLTVKHDGLPVVVRPLPIPLLLILTLLRVG